jgi:serine/threonine-protein kinase RsbW
MGLAGSNRRGDKDPRPSRAKAAGTGGGVGGGGGRRAKPTKSRGGGGSAMPPPPPTALGQLHRFTIPSDYDHGYTIQRRILEDVQRAGFTANSTFALKLALDEALVNAIKHGNRLDASKNVHIEYKVSAGRVEVSIEDEGPGFDRKRVPDPTAHENLCKASGRGILLIESYMNSARWDRGGRRVRMVRLNEPEELPERPAAGR